MQGPTGISYPVRMLREHNVAPRDSYTRPSARNMSIWIDSDLEDYVESVARERGCSKNRAFSLIIDEHRKPALRKAKRSRRP
jgi:hypothetical protein